MLLEMNSRGLVSLALQFLLPLLVGLVTKQSWAPSFKAVLLLAATAVGQLLIALQDSLGRSEHFNWQAWLWTVGVGFAISVAVHFGLWKPTGAADNAQDTLVRDSRNDPRHGSF